MKSWKKYPAGAPAVRIALANIEYAKNVEIAVPDLSTDELLQITREFTEVRNLSRGWKYRELMDWDFEDSHRDRMCVESLVHSEKGYIYAKLLITDQDFGVEEAMEIFTRRYGEKIIQKYPCLKAGVNRWIDKMIKKVPRAE